MATQFQIKKGLSTQLFDAQGKCLLRKKVEGCWYLTVDTAEVYVCVRSIPGEESSDLVLKRVNELGDFNNYYTKAEIDAALAEINTLIEQTHVVAVDAKALAQEAQASIVTLEGQVAEHATAISRVIDRVEYLIGVTDAHAVTLEAHDKELDDLAEQIKTIGDITNITANETIVTINNKLTALEAKDEELAAEIAVKANAADVYSKAEANDTFIKVTELDDKIDSRINTLIDGANSEDTITNVTNLIEFVNNNAGEIATLVTDVKTNTAAIAKNAADIVALDEKIEATRPKKSDEIDVDDNGKLSIKQMTTDKLVQGVQELILDGGSATEVAN